MKSKVLIVWPYGELWNVSEFGTGKMLHISSNRQVAVDYAVAFKSAGYRIHVVEDTQEADDCKKIFGKRVNKVIKKKMEAKLKGLFDYAHLRFKKIKIIK